MDDLAALQDELKRLNINLDDDSVPEFVTSESPEGDPEELDRQARQRQHAFKKTKDLAKAALGRAEEAEGKLQQMERQAGANVVPAGSGSQREQWKTYVANVAQRALSATGLSNPQEDELAFNAAFQMAISQDVAGTMVQGMEQNLYAREGGRAIEEVLEKNPMLNEDDQKAIRDRVAEMMPNERADPDVLQREVHTYLGENIGRFGKEDPEPFVEDGEEEPSSSSVPTGKELIDVNPGATAVSQVKSKGSMGVQPAGNRKVSTAPQLTPEDVKSMEKAGLVDPKAYLEAKKRKASYAEL